MNLKNIFTLKYPFRCLFKPKVVRHIGVLLTLDYSAISDWIVDAIYKGFYERAECNLCRRYIPHNSQVLEIGAGIGLIATYLSSLKNCTLTIYEPNPLLLPIINDNLSLNGAIAEVRQKAVCGASSPSTNCVSFYIGEHFWNASLIHRPGFKKVSVESIVITDIPELYTHILISGVIAHSGPQGCLLSMPEALRGTFWTIDSQYDDFGDKIDHNRWKYLKKGTKW